MSKDIFDIFLQHFSINQGNAKSWSAVRKHYVCVAALLQHYLHIATVTFVGHMLTTKNQIKSTKLALKHIEMKVLIYTIINFLILCFRFPLDGFLRGFKGGGAEIKGLTR